MKHCIKNLYKPAHPHIYLIDTIRHNNGTRVLESLGNMVSQESLIERMRQKTDREQVNILLGIFWRPNCRW